ncbi:malonyl-CoA decarboxylase, mitochondrial-like isoform X2 [Halichondria panicea]|uniref:malonyl-CoA decarboxylase, mitochondrial-like isoform X2 n=1 Tax=Halichondria panicea TaxID=6063 RepID=UPI00312B6280
MAFVRSCRRLVWLTKKDNTFSFLIKSVRYSSNVYLEGPFFTRLSSQLSHTAKIRDGLGLGPDSLSALNAARNDLVHWMGLNNEEGVAPETIANNMIDYYHCLGNMESKKLFLSVIAGDLGVDHERITTKAQKFVDLHANQRSDSTLLMSGSSLRQTLTPFYGELFSHIARVEGGIKFLVDLRGDLLEILKSKQSAAPGSSTFLLSELDTRLRETLSEWFTPQLMELQHITWESPCDILEKISDYEAVHRLRHWKDLKHRVGSNRRCFIFTHKAIPREPIVVLHVALTSEPSSSIQELLDRTSQKDTDISNAIFYSISATQKGLSGVELGNFLIRRAVDHLQREFPHQLTNFVTLSPIPGFRKWVESHLRDNGVGEEVRGGDSILPEVASPTEALRIAMATTGWASQGNGPVAQAIKQPLLSLCSRYLALEKRRGNALDPVAHFHLQNGASIWRINWLGDTSLRGLERSLGLMVNYRYHLPDINSNSDSYRIHGRVNSSELVDEHL